MKSLETTLTWILIPLFLVFVSDSIISANKAKAEKKELEKQAALDKAAAEKTAQERLERTVTVEIMHDSDPNTNTMEVYLYGGSSEDPEGDKMSYQWSQISGNPVDLGTVDEVDVKFDAEAGEYEFILAVSDNYGATCEVSTIINILPEANNCPEVQIDGLYQTNSISIAE